MNLESIAQKYQTPLYVYNADKIEEKIKTFKAAFSESPLKIKYAMKALSNINILRLMKKNGVGIDAVSLQEVELALRAGVDKKEILYTPNCVDFDEIVKAVELGVHVNIDSISNLEKFGHKYHGDIPCCVRLNPHLMAGGNQKISTGHIDSKFGISVYQLRHVHKIVEKFDMKINGLHVHTGSDILDANVFLTGADIIFQAAKDFKDLDFIDFGSGFKVPYKEDDVVTDINELGQKLQKTFKEFCNEYGKDLEIWFEPGKFLVSESGFLLTKATCVKTTPTTVFVGVDSGLHHLIRPMMYDAHHEIENISNNSGVQRIYTVVGQICETDTLGYDRLLDEVKEGDILAIKNAGAYGFSMSSNYNSRLRPAEVLIYQKQDFLIRKREEFDDLLKDQVQIDL
jgi:diaminopimelate decarboxylase